MSVRWSTVRWVAVIFGLLIAQGTLRLASQEATNVTLRLPGGVAYDSAGNFYIADTHNHRIRMVSSGVITTIAGTGVADFSGDGGAASAATLNLPMAITLDANGVLYIADTNNHRIRVISGGQISTVAGNGEQTYSGDGSLAIGAGLDSPNGVAVDSSFNLYIGDTHNQRIRLVTYSTGIISTLAGTGVMGFADGTATTAQLARPRGVSVDSSGTVYFADSDNHRVRTLASGQAATLAGNGEEGNTGDTGVSTSASLDTPHSVAVRGGSVAIADTLNQSIRLVTDSSIDTVAGTSNNGTEKLSITGSTTEVYGTGTLTATFSNGSNTATGSVVFYDGQGTSRSTIGTVTLATNAASLSTSQLSAGTHYIVAAYPGDSNNAAISSGAYVLIVTQAPLTDDPTGVNLTYGQTIPALTGTLHGVLSQDASKVSATYTSAATSTSAPGSYPITVGLTGSAASNYSLTASSASVVISKASSTGSLTASNPSPTYGASITLTATIASSTTGTPTGTVSFYDGTTLLNATPATLSGGVATLSLSILSVGTRSLTAVYSGDSNFTTVTAALSLPVQQATQSITFTQLASPVSYVAPITLSATGGASGNPVTFSVLSGPGSVSGSTLTISGAGTVVVAADQAGNANYSAAAQVTQSVVSVASSINLSVSALSFGSVPLGTTSAAQTVIITNPNEYAVTSTSIQASGDFTAASNCLTIAALSMCSVNVTFTPSLSGARTGTLTVSGVPLSSAQSAVLTGTGTAAGILITPAAVRFGSQVKATTSTGQAITIQNTGTAALVISNIATTGDFATTGNCANVPAGSNCNLTVTFTPTTTGSLSGTVTLTDNVGSGNQSQVINLTGIGTLAGATLTPSVQTFPSTLVGSSSFALNATLTNTGTATLTGIGVSILGDFTQTNTCGATLDPAATCTISVTYAPTVAGAESGTLTVVDNLGAQTVSLVGTGMIPGATLNTAQLIYGGQSVDTTSRAQTVIFTNTGTAAVSITSVVATSNFSDTTNCMGSIAAGASCSVNILFSPTATGSLSGTVTITDSAGTQVITMQGQGVSKGLSISPSFALFGAQVVGTTSQAQTLIATNTGTTALTLNPITVSNNFIESDECPTVLQAGATCAISVSFSPTATGTLAGSIVLSDASGQVSTMAATSGQGTLPGIATTPSTLSFGSLPVGSTSQAQTVTITNTGTAPLQIGTVSGTGDFAESDTCSSQTIAASGYCVISVTMTPTTLGTRTGTIQFNDNVDGLHQIALSGVGQQAGVSVSPTSLAFGSLPIVTSSQVAGATGTPLSVIITNTGNVPLQLTGITTQGDFTESDSCGSTVAVGGTCTLTVTFAATALGHRTGTLTITDNAGGGSQVVSLQGDGSPTGLFLTPAVLNFGVQSRGVTSREQLATLTNNTGKAITDLSISASGEFYETDNCGTSLANSASCTLHVTVKPEILGAITGTITIRSGSTVVTSSQRNKFRSLATTGDSSSDLGVVAVMATTNESAAAVNQLAFGTAPAPIVVVGGNAGAAITVLENDSTGSTVSATDTITLMVTGAGGYAKSYMATASGGVATFDLSGTALTTIGSYSYTASVASSSSIGSTTASETVKASGSTGLATPVITLLSSGSSLLQNAVTFSVALTSTVGTPTGSVNFLDGATLLGSGVLTAGSTTFTTSTLAVGSRSIVAIYLGDTNFAGVTGTLTQSVVDYSVSGSRTALTVIPGNEVAYTVSLAATTGTTIPAAATLTVTGLPSGATATLSAASWMQSTSTSWHLPANTTLGKAILSIHAPAQTAKAAETLQRKFAPMLLGFLLLPLAGKLRRAGKRMSQNLCLLLLLGVGAAAMTALSGCGSSNGFFSQAPKDYTVTVTVTAGTLSHSSNVTLTVQ